MSCPFAACLFVSFFVFNDNSGQGTSVGCEFVQRISKVDVLVEERRRKPGSMVRNVTLNFYKVRYMYTHKEHNSQYLAGFLISSM